VNRSEVSDSWLGLHVAGSAKTKLIEPAYLLPEREEGKIETAKRTETRQIPQASATRCRKVIHRTPLLMYRAVQHPEWLCLSDTDALAGAGAGTSTPSKTSRRYAASLRVGRKPIGCRSGWQWQLAVGCFPRTAPNSMSWTDNHEAGSLASPHLRT
jgi:hypothetical protein